MANVQFKTTTTKTANQMAEKDNSGSFVIPFCNGAVYFTIDGYIINDYINADNQNCRRIMGLPADAEAGDALVFDGTAWNKQDGYGYTTGSAITWDGDTTNKDNVWDFYFKVSSDYITYNDALGFTATALIDGTEVTATLSASNCTSLSHGWYVTYADETVIIVSDGELIYEDEEFAEGIWFVKADSTTYVQSLANLVIHQIDSKYLPDLKTLNGESLTGSENIIIEGLPEGTAAGNALIYNGIEWTQQDGYGYTTEGVGNYITWDGNTASKDALNFGGTLAYKVSDNIPSKTDLAGATCINNDDDFYLINASYTFAEYATIGDFTITSGDGTKLLLFEASNYLSVLVSLLAQTISVTVSETSLDIDIPSTGIFFLYNSASSYWKTLVYGNQITWDGDTTDKTPILFSDEFCWYKVSANKVDKVSELLNVSVGYVTMEEGEASDPSAYEVTDIYTLTDYFASLSSVTLVSGDLSKIFLLDDGYVLISAIAQTIVITMNETEYSFSFEAGTYFNTTQENSDDTDYWYESQFNYCIPSVIHKIDSKYIDAGLPTGTTAGNALVFDGTNWVQQSGYAYPIMKSILSTTSIAYSEDRSVSEQVQTLSTYLHNENNIGKAYSITYDDTVYTGTVALYNESLVYMGNGHIINSSISDTGEPFALEVYVTREDDGYVYFDISSDQTLTAHTFAVTAAQLIPIDPSNISIGGYGYLLNSTQNAFDITWDGDTTGMTVITPNNKPLYQISDNVYSSEDLLNCYFKFCWGSYDYEWEISVSNLAGITTHGCYIARNSTPLVMISDGSYTYAEVTIPAGLWFYQNSTATRYPQELSSISKIDNKYLSISLDFLTATEIQTLWDAVT